MQKLEFKMSVKALDYDKKAAASSKLMIEGYASTADRDRVRDIVLPQAFASHLAKFLETGTMLLNHDPGTPIGKWTEAKITEDGLYVKGFISETEKDLQIKIREGIYSTLSIGFNTIDQEWNSAVDSNVIKDLELLEVSVVTIPANSEARFELSEATQAKAAQTEEVQSKEVEAVLGAVIIDELTNVKAYNYKYVRGVISKSLGVTEDQLDQAYVRTILNEDEDSMKVKEAVKEIMTQLETEKKSTTVETTEVKESAAPQETKSIPSIEELAASVNALAEQFKSLESSLTEVKSLIQSKAEVVEEVKGDKKPMMGEEGSQSEEEEDEEEAKKKKEAELATSTQDIEAQKSEEAEEQKEIEDIEAKILELEIELMEQELQQD